MEQCLRGDVRQCKGPVLNHPQKVEGSNPRRDGKNFHLMGGLPGRSRSEDARVSSVWHRLANGPPVDRLKFLYFGVVFYLLVW